MRYILIFLFLTSLCFSTPKNIKCYIYDVNENLVKIYQNPKLAEYRQVSIIKESEPTKEEISKTVIGLRKKMGLLSDTTQSETEKEVELKKAIEEVLIEKKLIQ